MSMMFEDAFVFNQDFGNWNIFSVTTLHTFMDAIGFNQDIGSWDVSSVTEINSMVLTVISFNQDISTNGILQVYQHECSFLLVHQVLIRPLESCAPSQQYH